jgi:hypothetical protein
MATIDTLSESMSLEFIWRNYLDKMSGTLGNIRDPRYVQKAKQFANDVAEIDPGLFEEPNHQKKVREIVLFIKEALQSDMNRNNLLVRTLPPIDWSRVRVKPHHQPLSTPVVSPTGPTGVCQKRKQRKRRKRRNGRRKRG